MVTFARYGHRDLSPTEVAVPSLWNKLERAWVPSLQGSDGITEDSSFGGITTAHQGTVSGPKIVPTDRGYTFSLTGGNWWSGVQSNFDEESDFTLVIQALSVDMRPVFGFTKRALFSQNLGVDWLRVADTGTFQLESNLGGVTTSGPFDIVEDRWYVMGLTYKTAGGNKLKVWIDGVEGTENSLTVAGAGGNHQVGAQTTPTGFGKWKGTVGPVYLWQRALSTSEMRMIAEDPVVLFLRDDLRSESNVPVAGLTVLDWERKLRGGMRGGVRGGL